MSMSMSTHFAVVFLLCTSLVIPQLAEAQPSQAAFVSIDCGAEESYIDPLTTIRWQTDGDYIATGYNAAVGETPASNNISDVYSELKTIRVFDDTAYRKYCYSLPVVDNGTYSIRASFFYGASDVAGPDPPSFRLALDATVVANVSTSREFSYYFEYVFLARGNTTFLCLLRDESQAHPFISAISLRPAVMYTQFDRYLVDDKYIRTSARFNFGGTSRVRFPVDVHDRYWQAVGPNSTHLRSSGAPIQTLSTTHPINLTLYRDLIPEVVLQTAITAKGNITIQGLNINSLDAYLVLHFVELDNHTSNVSRKFMVHVPGISEDTYVNAHNFTDEALKPMRWSFWDVTFNSDLDTVVFYPRPRTSRLGPLVNAMELYSIVDVAAFTTFPQDAQAIEAMKESMNLTEWTGDPCLPVPHSWLICNPVTFPSQPRVSQVSLSGYHLQGTIPASSLSLLEASSLSLDNNAFTGTFPDLRSMQTLQHLHLHNNQLSGPLPDWLTNMSSLQELSIQNNNFSGDIPAPLLALNFTYRPGNPLLIESNSSLNTTAKSGGTQPVVHAAAYIITAIISTTLYM